MKIDEIPDSPGPLSPAAPPSQPRRRRFPWLTAIKVTGIASVVAVCGLALAITAGLPNIREIRELAAEPVTTLYDANDKPLFAVYKEERIEIPISQVSQELIHAVVAVEDEHFYKHTGVDFLRIAGAALADIKSRDRVQGGSTITQQLARKMFLHDRKTLWRKLREAALAVRIERGFSKDKILELYLNKVYFGQGYYGVEAASRGYFGKHASELGTDEGALLAGLIQAPSAYAPRAHPDRATARRKLVLGRMVEAGYLRQEDADRLARQPIQLHDAPASDGFARYFKSYVTRLLVQQFGEDRVFDDGLRVYTTLNRDVQLAAERTIAESLAKIEQQKNWAHPRYAPASPSQAPMQSTPYLQAALVALEPATGHIRALVGGRDVDQSPFDRATQGKRQAGSAFKPFIYAAAIESGYTSATVLTDLDVTTDPSSKAWVPDEAHGSTATSMTLQNALKTSSNRAAVRLLAQVGMSQAMTMVKRMGFDSIPAVPSMVLGTGEVSVLSMTAAYAAFANGGHVPTPVAIRRVESRSGDILYQDRSIPQAAISEVTAFIMAQMLADVVNSGTGYRVRQEGFTWPAGGKTGTTDDFRDVWFAGFTPALAATVWMGFDQPQRIARNGFAGDLAAPIWGRFMKAAVQQPAAGRSPTVVKAGLSTAAKPREGPWIPQPPNVTSVKICRISGLLASSGCSHVAVPDRDGFLTEKSMVTSVYFRRGTEPMAYCALHDETALVQPDAASTLPASLNNLNDLLRRNASGVIIR